ncbi:cytochrome C oxidase subunit IV family protein [Poseidonibacter sp.]|uniref:cytochrome C oxidase subunit IV family protein n=1 Tax=Poseidonibacter sp. TaxID=2321188 RepID=UPI003C74AF58
MENITKVWLGLLFLTLFAFVLGWLEKINSILVYLLLITTFFKGYLVVESFMGLSEVQLKYRIIPTVWLVTILFFIAIAYY